MINNSSSLVIVCEPIPINFYHVCFGYLLTIVRANSLSIFKLLLHAVVASHVATLQHDLILALFTHKTNHFLSPVLKLQLYEFGIVRPRHETFLLGAATFSEF